MECKISSNSYKLTFVEGCQSIFYKKKSLPKARLVSKVFVKRGWRVDESWQARVCVRVHSTHIRICMWCWSLNRALIHFNAFNYFQDYPNVTRKLSENFQRWLEAWVMENVSRDQKSTGDQWLAGNSDGLRQCVTIKQPVRENFKSYTKYLVEWPTPTAISSSDNAQV